MNITIFEKIGWKSKTVYKIINELVAARSSLVNKSIISICTCYLYCANIACTAMHRSFTKMCRKHYLQPNQSKVSSLFNSMRDFSFAKNILLDLPSIKDVLSIVHPFFNDLKFIYNTLFTVERANFLEGCQPFFKEYYLCIDISGNL